MQSETVLRGAEESRQANFLELFFDLVLVFALIGVVSRVVPDLLSDDARLRWLSLLYTAVLALPLLWLWTTTAHITSRFSPRCGRVQVLVLVSAFGLLIMSTSLPYAFVGHGLAFAVPYVLLQIGRLLVLRPLLRGREAVRSLFTRQALWFTASGVVWLWGAVVHGPYRVAMWSVAIAVDLVVARFNWPTPGMGGGPATAWAMASTKHLPERYQQLMLIALGETVVSIGITYTRHTTSAATVALVITFLSSVLLWRIYFYRAGQVLAEALAMSSDPAALGRRIGAAHLLMVLGIVAIAAGSEDVLAHPGGQTRAAWLVVILGGPAVFLLGRIRLERLVFNRLAVRRLVGIGALALLGLPLAFGPPLFAAAAAVAVLLGVALADARQAAGRPPEAPSPVT